MTGVDKNFIQPPQKVYLKNVIFALLKYWELSDQNLNCILNWKIIEKTTLSEHIWELTGQNLSYSINWKIIEKSHSFNPITLQCKLCLSEIYHIIVNPIQASLNRRLEVLSHCRHIKKFLLSKAQRWVQKDGALVIKSDMRWVTLLAPQTNWI